MNSVSGLNTRILVIDDEESVRDSFRIILRAESDDESAMELAANALFGDAPAPPRRPSITFEVDLATNGRDGAAMVEAAVKRRLPYAAVFCDMRMPGWDGVETIEEIRKHDQRVEVVLITAYSDHTLETILERAGANVGYFVKPFLTDEVKQLSTKVVIEWNKARELEELMRIIASLRGETSDIERLLQHLLSQICIWLDTESAALLHIRSGGPEFRIGVGSLSNAGSAVELIERAKGLLPQEGVIQLADGTTILPIQQFGMAVAIVGKAKITPDRKFLLQVFLENAALAIRNSEMQVELAEQQRMAAVGLAIGFILHDLRGPMGVAQTLMQLVRTDNEEFRPKAKMLELIDGYMHRALDIMGDTLAFSQGSISLKRERVPLAAALAGPISVSLMDLELRGIRLDVVIPEDLQAYVDPEKLDRALWNLTRNAVDAVAKMTSARIEIGAAVAEGGIDIWVADNGAGVSAEVAAKVFKPFSSIKKEGTGFGLAIVKQIVDAHGGRVAMERHSGTTRFLMFFPDAA